MLSDEERKVYDILQDAHMRPEWHACRNCAMQEYLRQRRHYVMPTWPCGMMSRMDYVLMEGGNGAGVTCPIEHVRYKATNFHEALIAAVLWVAGEEGTDEH